MKNKKKIVTIGGGNGQSNLLDAFNKYYFEDVEFSSIVSMSDDGRTTGKLMRQFEETFGRHLPPPGDLRRCLFMMSNSEFSAEFQQDLETVIQKDQKISELTISDYFSLVGSDKEFLEKLKKKYPKEMNFVIPIDASIKGHKVGNIMMANIYYNYDFDYHKMMEFMHTILKVDAHIIPVTTSKAYIRAVLGNGSVVETQDRISNVAEYTSGIADLELMESSIESKSHARVESAIKEADFIIITPGDLYTSIISNFIIGGVKEALKKSSATIILIMNSVNKGGETNGLTVLDFVNKITRYLGKDIDILIVNDEVPKLTESQRNDLQAHQSVKGGDYVILSKGEKEELLKRTIQVVEADLLDADSLYKHDKKKIIRILSQILSY